MSAVRKPWIVYWAFRNGNLSHCTEFLTKIIGSRSTNDFDDNKALAKSAVGFYGDTLLHLACRHGWLDLVNLLIKVYGYPPDVKDKGRQTPLHYACQYGHLDIVQYLLRHHACDATAATLDHWTPLHYACRYSHMNIVEYLVSLPSLRNVDQHSILHLTCKYGHLSILEYLMDKQGFTPSPKVSPKEKMAELLVTACQQDHVQIVHYLLKKIISYQNMQTEACKALFFFCCKHGLLDILKQLTSEICELTHITDKAGLLGVHHACHNGHTAIVKHLVEECGDNKNIIACDKKGLTPLHHACMNSTNGSNADVVWYMLSRPECDVLAQTDDGNTVLHFACVSKEFNPQVVDLLIKHGAVVSKEILFSVQTYMRSSPLKFHDSISQSAIVSYLLKISKCDPNIRNHAGISPIQLAIYPFIVRETLACNGQMDFFKWLVSKDNKVTEIKCCVSTRKLDLNQTASNGDTAFHLTCFINDVFVARYIYECNFVQRKKESLANDTVIPLISAVGFQSYRILREDRLGLFDFIFTFIRTVQWIATLAVTNRDGNTSLYLTYQAHLPMLTHALRHTVMLATKKSAKKLVPSNSSLIADYAHERVFAYTFKPGSLQQLIRFCENINTIQFERFIIQIHSNRTKWEHKETFDCCISDQILHIQSHPSVWLLIKVCCHSHTNGQAPLTMNEENYKLIHVIDIIEVLVDSTFNGTESKEELLLAACKQSKHKLIGYLISTLSYNIPKISLTIEPIVALTIIDDMLTSSRWSDSECVNTMKALEANNMDVYSRCNSKGFTAFHLAVLHHRYEVALFLLSQAKCDPNNRNKEGETPVHLLISNHRWSDLECTDIIKALMKIKQWDPNSICDSNGDTALHLSVLHHRYDLTLYLMSQAKCDPNKGNQEGETPVQLLIILSEQNVQLFRVSHNLWSDSECIDIIKTLIEIKQWDPNSICDSSGDTALHLSVLYHRYELTLYLLSQTECDPNIRNNKGYTLVELLLSEQEWSVSGCIDILKVLIATKKWDLNSICNSSGDTALHLSVVHYRPKVVLFLLSEAKCDPNKRNKEGETPVRLLISKQNIQLFSLSHNIRSDSECINIIKTLIATKQWDPNSVCNSSGDTALHLSVLYHRYELTLYLLSKAECDPNIKNEKGDSPVQLLISNEWTDSNIIETLIATKQWDPNSICNSSGDTALHLSVLHHRYKLTLYLLSQAKSDPNKRNEKGETPVQLLIILSKQKVQLLSLSHNLWSDSECIDIIKTIIAIKQWDPNSTCNSSGDTALHLSVLYHRYELTPYLLSKAECDPNKRNNKGSTLVELLLSEQKWSVSICIDILKVLIATKKWDPNSTCNSSGDTALHLSVVYHRPAVVFFLLSEAKCDPNCRNYKKQTPLLLATDSAVTVIRDLIRYGANPDNVYKSFGKTVGLKNPLIPPVKVFIVGNSGVGKSTLTKALKIETSFLVRAFTRRQRVSGVDEKTAGIVPHDFKSKLYGRVIFYDFAGHREFYNSHVAILQNVIQKSSPIFLIVVNLSNSKKEVEQSVLYWLSFLENNVTMAECKSHVIIIGSHADISLARGEDPQQRVSEVSSLIRKLPDISTIEFVGMYPIDCRYSESTSMVELRSSLKSSCTSLRRVDTISFNAHCFHVFLLDKFRVSVAVNIKDLQTKIQKVNKESKKDVVSYLPDNILILTSVCDELNDRGHIIFLKNDDKLENSWVIIDKASLLSKVTGTIFAPKDFKEHCQIAECTGVVPLSRLIEHFPEYSLTSEILIGFLTHFEFCREIVDQELLELIGKHQDSLKIMKFPVSENERYFLFPGLITLEAPSDIWKQSLDLKYHCGWIFKCHYEEQFFSSRFTQVLLLRLAFSFALIKQDMNMSIPALQRECSIWKNGIFWGEIFGMEIIVEIQSNMVVLLTRCHEENLINCIAQRSSIIRKICQCAQDICANIETVESFIDPSETTEFPLKSSVSEISQFGLQAIVEAITKSAEYESLSIVSSKCTISLDHLLIFEPYAELGITLLKELCTRISNCDKKVSNRFLQRLSLRLSRKSKLFIKMFRSNSSTSSSATSDLLDVLKTWRDECTGTYKCLKDKFDQFSIFAGRNDLVSARMIDIVHVSIQCFNFCYRNCLQFTKSLKKNQKRKTCYPVIPVKILVCPYK